jgi:hypothetical protein
VKQFSVLQTIPEGADSQLYADNIHFFWATSLSLKVKLPSTTPHLLQLVKKVSEAVS